MSSDTKPFDEVADTWEAISNCLERFQRAWASAEAPELGAYLPAGPVGLRRLALVELIKLDIDYRLMHGQASPLESYVEAFPELADGGVPCDLLYEDFHMRRQRGEPVEPADYYRRFPARAQQLAQLLDATTDQHKTSILAACVPKTLRAGDRVDDFELLAMLGEGRFAQVFLARQQSMQRLVALKVSAQRGAEAQTLAQLDHPHIVRVYDQRVLADSNVLLVYMPYLAGGTLQDVVNHVRSVAPAERSGRTLLRAVDLALERRGELPPAASGARALWAQRSWPATVCALGMKLARALDYAHRRQVLHRDIKPPNILLTAEGEPLLADFNVGCCSKLDGAGPVAMFGGSLAYMSPEHLEAFNPDHARAADSLDGRADVYSLAITLWELLTGSRPFPMEKLGGSWPETLAALTRQRHAGPSAESIAALPEGDVPGLREVLLRCLDPDAARRPRDAGALARELELCLRPATRALLRPAPGGWRELVRRHPLLTMYPAGLAPNLLAALFNIVYNRAEIVAYWEQAAPVFERIILIVNGIFFPLGMVIWALLMLPVVRAVGRRHRGEAIDEDSLARLRRHALRLGQFAAAVCVACWVVAGVIWPLALRILAGPPSEGPAAYVHFLLSLAACGMIAAAYPYFIVTYLSVHVIYPMLLGPAGPVAEDTPALARLERELGLYRAVATAVPLLALVLLATMRGASNAFAIAVLSVTGLAGTVLAFALEGRIRADLAALTEPAGTDERPS
jgi:serine/threonine protein kinase